MFTEIIWIHHKVESKFTKFTPLQSMHIAPLQALTWTQSLSYTLTQPSSPRLDVSDSQRPDCIHNDAGL